MGANNLIYVTVGTSQCEFTRLIKKMDEISGKIEEKVIIQKGHGDFKPINADYFSFVSKEKADYYYKKARVVVSHAGVGSIVSATKLNKPIILVPRIDELNEDSSGNHQKQICEKLKDKIKVVWEIENLEYAISNIEENKLIMNSNKLTNSLKMYINSLENNKR